MSQEQKTMNASEIMVPVVTFQEINAYDFRIILEQDLTKAGTDDEWAFFTTEFESWRQEATQAEFLKFKEDGHFEGNFVPYLKNDKLVFWINNNLATQATSDIRSGEWVGSDEDETRVHQELLSEHDRLVLTHKIEVINELVNEKLNQ
jgi:hypothetical protein